MLPIVRGKMSHSFRDDFVALFKCFFVKLDDKVKIKEFEAIMASKIGHTECIAFSYARSAFYFILKSLDLKPGDYILMPPIHIKAFLDVVLELKLKPLFVDSDLNTASFDLDSLRNNITKYKPKACLLTYLFGLMPSMDNIMFELKKNKIFIIEDFSQSLNAHSQGRKAGTFGDVSIYSSSAVKTLDTYGGGLAFTSNPIYINSLRRYQLSVEPIPRIVLIKKVLISFVKNIVTSRFVYSIGIFQILKFLNSRGNEKFDRFVGFRPKSPITKLPKDWFYSYTSVQAAAGLKYLSKVEERDISRTNYARDLIMKISNIKLLSGDFESSSVYWQLIALPESPKKFRKHLYLNKIDSAFTSLIEISQLPEYKIKSFTPNADYLYKNGVYLPCYAGIKTYERNHVIKTILSFG